MAPIRVFGEPAPLRDRRRPLPSRRRACSYCARIIASCFIGHGSSPDVRMTDWPLGCAEARRGVELMPKCQAIHRTACLKCEALYGQSVGAKQFERFAQLPRRSSKTRCCFGKRCRSRDMYARPIHAPSVRIRVSRACHTIRTAYGTLPMIGHRAAVGDVEIVVRVGERAVCVVERVERAASAIRGDRPLRPRSAPA